MAVVTAELKPAEQQVHVKPPCVVDVEACVVQDANTGHQSAGGNSSWCPEWESRTTHPGTRPCPRTSKTSPRARLIGLRKSGCGRTPTSPRSAAAAAHSFWSVRARSLEERAGGTGLHGAAQECGGRRQAARSATHVARPHGDAPPLRASPCRTCQRDDVSLALHFGHVLEDRPIQRRRVLRTNSLPPSRVGQHVAVEMATERSATIRLKDSPRPAACPSPTSASRRHRPGRCNRRAHRSPATCASPGIQSQNTSSCKTPGLVC